MYNLALYGVTIVVWGSTWIVTKYQVEESSTLLAVMFRYILAAALLQLIVNLLCNYPMRYLILLALFSSCSIDQAINDADLIVSSNKVILMTDKRKAQPLSIAIKDCLLYTSPSPRDGLLSRLPSSA